MRILLAIIVLAALGWSGYWLFGKLAMERGLRGWLEARAAEGWAVHYRDLTTRGFPNRFDTTLRGLELADPGTGVAWTAPVFQILALSYRPHHVILAWPDEQRLATPRQKIDIDAAEMRGSAVFEPRPALPLDRAVVEFDTVALASDAGWQTRMGSGQLALRRVTGRSAPAYDLALDAQEVSLPSGLARLLVEQGLVRERLERLTVDAGVVFDRPWDRRAVEDRRPQPREIDLRLARAEWGGLELRLAGQLDVAPGGIPEGTITVQAQNWREILRLAEASGAVPAQLVPMLEGGLERLASLSGNPTRLQVPLRFSGGRMSLGGIVPLGRAPRLELR